VAIENIRPLRSSDPRVAAQMLDHEALPPPARDRLGMTAEHKNVLVRLDIRPLDRTLTDADANLLRDRVYAAIHRGARGEWAAER
jgi:phenylalanyl-tRNA synthetase alpha chain